MIDNVKENIALYLLDIEENSRFKKKLVSMYLTLKRLKLGYHTSIVFINIYVFKKFFFINKNCHSNLKYSKY